MLPCPFVSNSWIVIDSVPVTGRRMAVNFGRATGHRPPPTSFCSAQRCATASLILEPIPWEAMRSSSRTPCGRLRQTLTWQELERVIQVGVAYSQKIAGEGDRINGAT